MAVPTFNPFRPIVIEKYKHPFLYAHDSGQEICMTGFNPPQGFSAKNMIQVLEEGFNALVHGYDPDGEGGITASMIQDNTSRPWNSLNTEYSPQCLGNGFPVGRSSLRSGDAIS